MLLVSLQTNLPHSHTRTREAQDTHAHPPRPHRKRPTQRATPTMSKINIERPECYMDLYDEYREAAMEERLPWDAGFKKPTTPASLRGKIRRFLETYNVTSTSFQRVIGVNPGSFNTFMTGKYKDPWAACGNCTYDSAEYFFHFEKKAGKNSFSAKFKASQGAKGPSTLKPSTLNPKLSPLEPKTL